MIGLAVTVMAAAAAVSGCFGSGQTENTAVSETTAAPAKTVAEEASQVSEKTAEPVEITIMSIDTNGNALGAEGADQVMTQIEEYTGVKPNITWVAQDSYEDKLGVTLMDKANLPMIITINTNLNTTIVSAAKAGAFYDLNEYIFDEEKYPNLSQANKEVLKSLTVNGQLIGLYRARPIGRNGWSYRKDWADKLGLEEPKTIEDFYNMCYQFTYGDPDGNGVDDTYGICMSSYVGPIDMAQTWFGAGNGWVEKDGKLVPNFYLDEYKEAVDFFKKMFDEGLIYKDWAVRDTSSWRDGCTKGECGIWMDVMDGATKINDYFHSNNIAGVNGEEVAYMEYVGPLAKEEGEEPKTLATSGMSGFFVITKAADTPEKLEACLTFLDKMGDDEMLKLAQYGLEGIQWEKNAEGRAVILDAGQNSAEKANNGLQQLCAFIPNRDPQDVPAVMTEWAEKETESVANNAKYVVYNPATGYLANSVAYTTNGANLNIIIQVARTQYICGQIDWDGFQAAVKNWENQGGIAVMEEVNSQYQAEQAQ